MNVAHASARRGEHHLRPLVGDRAVVAAAIKTAVRPTNQCQGRIHRESDTPASNVVLSNFRAPTSGPVSGVARLWSPRYRGSQVVVASWMSGRGMGSTFLMRKPKHSAPATTTTPVRSSGTSKERVAP